jgi:hypothetical protein
VVDRREVAKAFDQIADHDETGRHFFSPSRSRATATESPRPKTASWIDHPIIFASGQWHELLGCRNRENEG